MLFRTHGKQSRCSTHWLNGLPLSAGLAGSDLLTVVGLLSSVVSTGRRGKQNALKNLSLLNLQALSGDQSHLLPLSHAAKACGKGHYLRELRERRNTPQTKHMTVRVVTVRNIITTNLSYHSVP